MLYRLLTVLLFNVCICMAKNHSRTIKSNLSERVDQQVFVGGKSE